MEPLIIQKVRLRNFLSHADSTLEFSKGVNVLIGPNGAGKSSVLEAIYYALTGRGWRTTRPNQVTPLIREGASSAEVTLEFVMEGRRYIVHRYIGGNRRDVITVDGKVAAQGKSAVSDFIRSVLGLSIEQVDKVVLIPQGGITRLFTQLSASKRKEAIDKLLGLHAYQEAGEVIREVTITANIAGVPKGFRPKRNELVREARRLAEYLREKEGITKKQIEEVRKEIEEVRKRLTEIGRRAAELEAVAKRYGVLEEALSRARAEKEAVEARLRDAEGEIRRLRETVNETEEELESLSREAGELEQATRAAGLRERVEELGRLIERVAGLSNRVGTARDYLEELERKLARIRELEESVQGELGELRERLQRVLARVEGLTEERASLMTKIGRARERAITIREVLEKSERDLARVMAAVARVTGEEPASEEVEEIIESLLRKTASESESIENEIRKLVERIGGLRSSIEDSKRKLALIERAKTPKCPLCGSPLTPEHREKIVRELREEIRALTKELGELEERLKDLQALKEEVRVRASIITPDLLRSVRELRKQIEEARDELRRLREEEAMMAERLRQVEDELRKASEEEEALRAAIGRAELLEELRKGFSIGDYEKAKEEVERAEKELTETKAKIAELVKNIAEVTGVEAGPPATVYEKAKELVEEAEEAARRLAEIRARLDEVRARREEALKELRAKEEHIGNLRRALKEVTERLDTLSKEFEEVKKAREELERLRGEEAALKERLSSLEERHDSLIEELETLRRAVEEARRAFRVAYVALWLAENVYSRDGLPKKIRPKILRFLENYVEKLADKFNLGFQDIRIDEDYDISLVPIDNPRVRRHITSLSGGEQVSLSMAALLAMFYVVSGSRIGFMALDEPTEYLDEERQRALVELFRRFQGGKILPQLIVVTHDESIKEVADRLYMVEKVDGVSRVTPVEPGEWA